MDSMDFNELFDLLQNADETDRIEAKSAELEFAFPDNSAHPQQAYQTKNYESDPTCQGIHARRLILMDIGRTRAIHSTHTHARDGN